MKISNQSFLFYFVIIIFRCVLEISYVTLINPVYGDSYLKFGLNFSVIEYVTSWVMFLSSLIFLQATLTKVSDFASLTLVVSVITPVSVIIGYDSTRNVIPLFLTFIPLISIWIFCDLRLVKPIKLPRFKNSGAILSAISWGMVGYLVVLYFVTGAAFNANLDFTKVYEFRDVNSKLTDFGVFSYFNIWAYKVFAAFLFCSSLLTRRFGLSLIIVFLFIFFYAVNNHKAVFFLPFLLLSIWYYFKKTNSALVIPLGLGMLIVLVLVINVFIDIQYIASMIIRRLFFVPAALTFDYYEFTNLNGYVYWRDSVFSFLGGYKYDLPLSFSVGEYLLSDELGANNGFVSTGYAHAGVLGVVLYACLFAYILRLIDHVTQEGVPLWLALAMTAIPIRAMIISSDFFTVLLTHGLLLSTVLLLMLPKKGIS